MGDNRYNPNEESTGSYLTQDGQRGGTRAPRHDETSARDYGASRQGREDWPGGQRREGGFGHERGHGDHGGRGDQGGDAYGQRGGQGYRGQQGGFQGERGAGHDQGRGNFGGAGNYGGQGQRFSQQEHHEGTGYGPYGQRGQAQSEGAYGQDRQRGDAGQRGGQSGGYGYQASDYEYQDRGFMARAGDEVRSWMGDERAQRRRELDQRFDEREGGGSQNWGGQDRGGGDRDESEARYPGGVRGYSNQRGPTFQDGEWIGTGSGWARGSDEDDYGSWRRQQIESLDRDYDEYRRENRQRFHSEFENWRTERQGQRSSLRSVREHMEVVGSDGEHVGTVDHVLGDRILLTKSDSNAGGKHHSIPSRWIEAVGEKVMIRKTAQEAIAAWREEQDDKHD